MTHSVPHEALHRLIDLATPAPSIHNTQPWRWRVTEDRLELHADPTLRGPAQPGSRGGETRDSLQRDVLGGLAHPLILVRIGWQPISRSQLPRTSRRPVNEVLDLS
jgi:Nitroreductase family